MSKCVKCRHQNEIEICEGCYDNDAYEGQTNADRIRAMSNEELYNLIEKIKMCGGLIRTEATSSECKGCKDGFCCNVLQWLKSEVKE